MRHREPDCDWCSADDVEECTTGSIVIAPTIRGIGRTEHRDVLRATIDHGQSIEMTAVVSGQSGNELGVPLWGKRIFSIESDEARETCGDRPLFTGGVVSENVNSNVACRETSARHETRVTTALRINR